MVRATSCHHKGTGELDVCQILRCCYLITMLASFLGPRLRGDHHVNQAVMVSLVDMDLLLGTEQALMIHLVSTNVAVVINVYCYLRG